MANEITLTVGLTATKSYLSVRKANTSVSSTMTGTHYYTNVQDVGTTYEAVALGADLGTAGIAYFRNLDTTNYAEIGLEVSSAFYAFAKLKPGEQAGLRLGTSSIFAKANTAAVKLEIVVLED